MHTIKQQSQLNYRLIFILNQFFKVLLNVCVLVSAWFYWDHLQTSLPQKNHREVGGLCQVSIKSHRSVCFITFPWLSATVWALLTEGGQRSADKPSGAHRLQRLKLWVRYELSVIFILCNLIKRPFGSRPILQWQKKFLEPLRLTCGAGFYTVFEACGI